jgi:hypothetical protein
MWSAVGGEPGLTRGDPPLGPLLTPVEPPLAVLAWAGLALLVSHGASFVANWLGRGEYRTASPSQEMQAPYGRVIVLHLTIIFGAFATMLLGAPIWALVILVTLKTAVDLRAHLADRDRAATRDVADATAPTPAPRGATG